MTFSFTSVLIPYLAALWSPLAVEIFEMIRETWKFESLEERLCLMIDSMLLPDDHKVLRKFIKKTKKSKRDLNQKLKSPLSSSFLSSFPLLYFSLSVEKSKDDMTSSITSQVF